MREEIEITVISESTIRVDRYIAELGILTRNQLKERNLTVYCKGKEVKQSSKVRNGDIYLISWDKEEDLEINPEKMDIRIIYEDSNCLILDKDQGVVVHPSNGNYTGTLVQGLMFYLKNLSNEFNGDKIRPGIVHRLDKDTSGLMIVAKNTKTLEFLSKQFRDRTNIKEYLAIVKGKPEKKRGTIINYIKRDPLDRKKFVSDLDDSTGKYSETDYIFLGGNEDYSLLKLTLKTGRTHQIRVHLKYLGHPIVGDPIYSRKDSRYPDLTLMLHSFYLSIKLLNSENLENFYSEIPKRFIEFLENESIPIPSILEDHIN